MEDEDSPDEETQLRRSPNAASAVRATPRLVWQDRSGTHHAAVLKKSVLGSAAGADIVVADPTVSRIHAELDPRADGLWVRDLQSRNGTYVNGLFSQAVRLNEVTNLRVGSTDIRIAFDSIQTTKVELWSGTTYGRLVGRSAMMRELFATLDRIARTDASVLLHGETGTGKELVARAIHDASQRSDKPFIVVDCASLPDQLLAAELFGHTRGAFTGAVAARAGAFEAADGGTVFLDEIGELPLEMQPKLLRALESRMVRRIGETAYRNIDVRFLSATHRDLLTMVSTGAFREDLYFRLAVIPVSIPPLRERKEDIPMLVNHFLSTGNIPSPPLSQQFIGEICARPWRGNVRELRNFVDRVRALGASEALAMAKLSPESTRMQVAEQVAATEPDVDVSTPRSSVDDAIYVQAFKDFRDAWIEHGERTYLVRLLERHGRNVAAASKEAGVDRTYVYRLMRKYDL